MDKNTVYSSHSGSGNSTVTFDYPIKELVFISDDTSDITLVVTLASGTLSFTIKEADVLDERFTGVYSVSITASGAWRMYTRSERKK